MRKYQQLALLVLSAISVIILILYKNENQRLKDVLYAVNIFGRTDEAVLKRLENSTSEDDVPYFGIPAWQQISENYHTYGVYWNRRNQLIAGGEAFALVVGKKDAVINFGCSLKYDTSDGTRNVRGKFHFQRADSDKQDTNSEFTIYYFFCRVLKDLGNPEMVVFNDITNSKHIPPELQIRHIEPASKNFDQNSLNVCVDFVTPNRTKDNTRLMQFFLHHQGLGIMDFIVYNGGEVPKHVIKILRRFKMRLHMLPFNFPFSMVNETERIRKIIETDCLIRNTNIATYALLLEPHEFFYPSAKLGSSHSILRSIHHHAEEVTRFELPTFSVCVDRKHKLLVDSNLYDPEEKMKHKIYIYRTLVPVSTATALTKSEEKTQSVALSLSMAFAHSYTDCTKVGKDGLHDWRNSLRKDFMQYLQELRNELDVII